MTNDLFELLKHLSNSGIKYVVCGGVACVLHGVERATYDLDIAVSFDDDNLKKLIEQTRLFNMMPRIPEPAENLLSQEIRAKWLEERTALVYTFVSKDSPLQLDIFLRYPLSFETLLRNSEVLKIDDLEVAVSSIEDLLIAKSSIEDIRPKDISDIKELNEINERRKKGSGKD